MMQQETIKLGPEVAHLKIHLTSEAREQASNASLPALPHFHDIADYHIRDGFVCVQLHNQTEFCYPAHTVMRVKYYITRENEHAA